MYPFVVESRDSNILYQSGQYQFTEQNANELIQLGEFLAGSRFSSAEKKALQTWSIKDFKLAPKAGVEFYKRLSRVILPKIKTSRKSSQAYKDYRVSLYLDFIKLFKDHPEYNKSPDSFLAIINRYQPPKKAANLLRQRLAKESILRQQIENNLILQQMQMNQMMFNSAVRQHRQSTDMMLKSIRDQSIRNSITLPGGTILHETDSTIVAEDYQGEKFQINK